MEIKQLCDALMGKARTEALKKLVTGKRNRVVTVDGLAGSAVAMVIARLPRLSQPYLVVATDIDVCACGQMVEQAVFGFLEKRRRVPPEESIRRARARLGEGGYDLLNNNCEHFARACVLGTHESEQVRKALGRDPMSREGEKK